MFVRLCLTAFIIQVASLAYSQSSYDVVETGIAELQNALLSGEVTSVELVDTYLERIAAYDKQGPTLNSIVRINADARQQAAQLDEERRRSGPRSLLHGIPILVKDNYNTATIATTNGSVALANFTPPENATVVQRLLDAGAIVLGKTALHEYARGITTIASLTGQTANPYDLRRVPGGSSGGTGAAVAASFAAIGMGSDTCGSIRIPAAFNNLFGLRPTKGLTSIYGVMPLSHTQDVVGPLARSLDDLAILLDLITGPDANDPATVSLQEQPLPLFRANLGTVSPQGLRLGKLTGVFEESDASVRRSIETALEWYEEQGARIIDIQIPELDGLLGSSGVIFSEFRTDLESYLEQFAGDYPVTDVPTIFNNGLYHASLEQGMRNSVDNAVDADAYNAALAQRGVLLAAVEKAFQDYNLDAIVYPVVTENPVFTGEPQPGSQCALAANSGLPALSMAVGFNSRDLPVGMELLGLPMQDAKLLAIAYPYEQSLQPRQAPSTTPQLRNGVAPQAITTAINFQEEGIGFALSFEFDLQRNILHYEVQVDADNRGDIYAVVLSLANSADDDVAEPVILNLLGPQTSQARGDYYMSAAFREAFPNSGVLLRVFAESLPVTGLSRVID